jgi:enamine deaminase RidA (YjgF/YER057c/UK114 family)
MSDVQRYNSGLAWEEAVGYSRAVAVGPHCFVSGTTSIIDGVVHHEGDPYKQAVTAFTVALEALAHLGFTREDVVRTRMYVLHTRDMDDIGRAHKDFFDAVRPAATMIGIDRLIDPRMLVEVEVDAYREGPR